MVRTSIACAKDLLLALSEVRDDTQVYVIVGDPGHLYRLAATYAPDGKTVIMLTVTRA